LPGRPQQVPRPLPPLRPRRGDHLPGERRRLRRHRRRPPPRDIAGARASTPRRRHSRTGCTAHTVYIQPDMPPATGPCDPGTVLVTAAHQAEASKIAAELAAIAATGMILPGSITIRRTRFGPPNCACHADPPRLPGPYG